MTLWRFFFTTDRLYHFKDTIKQVNHREETTLSIEKSIKRNIMISQINHRRNHSVKSKVNLTKDS